MENFAERDGEAEGESAQLTVCILSKAWQEYVGFHVSQASKIKIIRVGSKNPIYASLLHKGMLSNLFTLQVYFGDLQEYFKDFLIEVLYNFYHFYSYVCSL